MTHARRRGLLPSALLAVLLVGACTGQSPDSEPVGPDTEATVSLEDTDRASVSAPSVQGCTPPPPLPATIPTFEAMQAPTAASADSLTATVQTSCGNIEIELDGRAAPVTVASFEFLSAEGFWEDSPCHRLTTEGIHVLQCGDPTGTGRGGPGYTFGIENEPPDGQYPRGTLAMARTQDPDSNGGQFFIVHQDSEIPVELGGYTIFGRVTGGMDIIDRIAAQGVDGGGADGMPAQPISILGVEVNEERATDS
ncbi:MAG: peptidylprolyl isomerase [Actinomycetota bacterium]|jgi:peptidyl-prolyl cis-trans isomerase B (cyclophilin B)|nr:peptidylprolyl isomerase [Actinomycetota bacterium]